MIIMINYDKRNKDKICNSLNNDQIAVLFWLTTLIVNSHKHSNLNYDLKEKRLRAKTENKYISLVKIRLCIALCQLQLQIAVVLSNGWRIIRGHDLETGTRNNEWEMVRETWTSFSVIADHIAGVLQLKDHSWHLRWIPQWIICRPCSYPFGGISCRFSSQACFRLLAFSWPFQPFCKLPVTRNLVLR